MLPLTPGPLTSQPIHSTLTCPIFHLLCLCQPRVASWAIIAWCPPRPAMSDLFCRRLLEGGTSELLRSTLNFLHCQPHESREASWDFHSPWAVALNTQNILLWSSLATPPSLTPHCDSLQLRPQVPLTGLLSSRLEAEGMESQTTIKQRRALWEAPSRFNPSCQTEVLPKVCAETRGQCLPAWPGGCGPAGASCLALRASRRAQSAGR